MSLLPAPATLAVFVAASMVMLITPGPAVFYIVARSVDQGRLAGVVSVLGVTAGGLVHATAAALGVSALIASSALAFSVLKYVGAAYLIWIGVRKLLERDATPPEHAPPPRRLRRLFAEGFVVNLTNPKTALFFLAFLPQFVDVARGPVAAQMLALGAVFLFLQVLSDGAYAVLAGSAGDWLRRHRGMVRVQRRFAGSVFIGLGVATALVGRR